MSIYQTKYLKYKNKYLQLKTDIYNQIGGDKPFITTYNDINLFIDPEMEKYLNPIYGLYMCESGYIMNKYWLAKSKLITEDIGQKILKLTTVFPGTGEIYPTRDIIRNITPIDIGRYIGLLYICKIYKSFFVEIRKDNTHIFTKALDETNKLLTKYIMKVTLIKNQIKLNTAIEEEFHIVLYCLWWILNDNAGVKEYYNGIEEVFKIYSSINPAAPIIFNKKKLDDTKIPSFEKVLVKITSINFNIISQTSTKHFCDKTIPRADPKIYADCGEVTARNLVNLICYDGKKFDINILVKMNAIKPLLEYYSIFNNFSLQSDIKPKKIYDLELNARDAWSRLLIFYAKDNITFYQKCNEPLYGYEVYTGMTLDNKKTNFFQLIQNLLPGISSWEGITRITNINIDDVTKQGIGDIIIRKNDEVFTITCYPQHYAMNLTRSNSDFKYNILDYTEKQKQMIKILKKNEPITVDNYIWYLFNPDFLVDTINNILVEDSIKVKLCALSLTDRYIEDTRSRININVESEVIIELFKTVNIINKIDLLNQYKYICNNFDFVKVLSLSKLTCVIKDKSITAIDLSPLSNLISIGNSFLYSCYKLKNIDLTPLSKLRFIGNNFASNCTVLESINLSGLSNLESIGNYFSLESYIKNITLSGLSNLKSIGDYFCRSSQLTTIDLSKLLNLTSIGNNFLDICYMLVSIQLPPSIKSINSHFLSGCYRLKNIDLIPLSNVTTIGSNFLNGCRELKTIDLSPLSNVTSIGPQFLASSGLETINLLPLSNVTSIGYGFLEGSILTEIDLSPLTNITLINKMMFNQCRNLKTIKLNGLSKVTRIGDNFINYTNIDSIDLSPLSQLISIGDSFISYCKNLKHINMSGLSKLTSIDESCLRDCNNLESIDLSNIDNLNEKCIANLLINIEPINIIKIKCLPSLRTIIDKTKIQLKIQFKIEYIL